IATRLEYQWVNNIGDAGTVATVFGYQVLDPERFGVVEFDERAVWDPEGGGNPGAYLHKRRYGVRQNQQDAINRFAFQRFP
ncbi:hypothetical protein Q6243_27730, partial [Klebsiella pneumoniae]|nr:hypothetical protein [Klebsiella pneumoniae]